MALKNINLSEFADNTLEAEQLMCCNQNKALTLQSLESSWLTGDGKSNMPSASIVVLATAERALKTGQYTIFHKPYILSDAYDTDSLWIDHDPESKYTTL